MDFNTLATIFAEAFVGLAVAGLAALGAYFAQEHDPEQHGLETHGQHAKVHPTHKHVDPLFWRSDLHS